MKSLPLDYQNTLRRMAPAGTSAVMANDHRTLASGILRAGDRDGVLEFEVTVELEPELKRKMEAVTTVRELGLVRNIEFRLIEPPKWNPARDCWDLKLPSAARL